MKGSKKKYEQLRNKPYSSSFNILEWFRMDVYIHKDLILSIKNFLVHAVERSK